MSRSKALISLVLLTPILLLCVRAGAQSAATGRIVGTIKDEHGAVISAAEVSARSTVTADIRIATTDEDGNFSLPLLSPGKYQISIVKTGFARTILETEVSITQTTRVDASLSVAGVDTVTVVVDPLIETDGPQMGRVVPSRTISELPLSTRNFTQILSLSPGTSGALADNTGLGRNSQNVSVNGARVTQNNYEINGIDANKIDTNSAASLAVPAPETIQEFKVQTSLYDATFGRGGGNVQAVTRSGGNVYHGAAYEYLRADVLNANNPFLKAAGVRRPTLQRNVFGALLGGPIKKNRLSFFGSYQGTRERNGASRNSLTSSVFVAQGLTDDRSAQKLLATFRPRQRNGLPALSIDPAALALLNARLPDGSFLIPTPQADGHYSGSAISTYREDQANANFDNRFTERDSLAVKLFFSRAPQFLALPGGVTNVPGIGADRRQNNILIAVQDIHTFSERTVNEVRAGYNFIRQDTFGRNPIRDSDIGIKRANADIFPGLGRIMIGAGATNAVTIGNSGLAVDIQTHESSTTFVDILSLIRGRQSIRVGAEVIDYRLHLTTNNNRRGQITFANFNNFLVGSANNSTYGEGINTRNLRMTDYSGFVQDDWKLSPGLTLNLGLRYELDLPPYETRGAISAFDPALYRPRLQVDISGSPIGPPVGGLVQAGNALPQYDLLSVPNVSKRVVTHVNVTNFAPRVGFAYSPGKGSPFVIRGGYGIFYSRASTLYLGADITMDFPPMYVLKRSPAGSPVPLEDPFFPLPLPDQFPTIVTGVALAGNTFDRNLRTPYFQQYNFGAQYQLRPHMLLELAYVGTRGMNLFRNVAINQARLASPERPIFNEVVRQFITTNNPANAPLRAPYQGVEVAGFTQIQSTAQSTYNSLQMSFTKRASKGMQLLASYTLSKSLDNGSGNIGSIAGDFADIGSILGDQLNNRANRGLSDFDRTHRFVLSFLWDLPRPSFADSPRRGLFFSNWQVAGIVTAMSGLPIDIVDGGAGSLYGLGNGNNPLARPNWANGATPGRAMLQVPAGYFFNPTSFVRPVIQAGQLIPSSNGAARADAVGTDLGNVGRNVLRGPAQTNIDFSIIKRFPFGEAKSIELHAEFFNLLNHVNFANPISNLNAVPATSINNSGEIIGEAGDFGRLTAASNNPRLIQFAVKLSF